jgi:hypothetical protein
MLFDYDDLPHARRHGPAGYDDHASFKPWLRDEFTFRCAYCLMRERWFPDGHGAFTVEHVIPQIVAPELICDYDNLVYACRRCNSIRRNEPVLDPCSHAYSEHVRVLANGEIVGLTPTGVAHIRALRLDDPTLTEARGRLLLTVRELERSAGEAAPILLQRWFGFPDNLPNLAILRPPGGNTRPAGVGKCHYQRRIAGELPDSH